MMSQPQPGHPDPAPEPGPPQPIPPPDPVPAPEPPHAAAQAATAGAEPHATERPPVWPLPVDTERTWHLPPPPTMHRGAHEANWPATPGQRQWLPEPHHDGNWHPQHERRPGEPADERLQEVPAEAPATAADPAPRSRRTALWVSLASVLTLLLCGGGAVSAYLLLRNAENGGGAPDPSAAVTRFMSAVYAEQDAEQANELLCREARDSKKIAAKVDEVRGYARQYDGPQFRWAAPAVSAQEDERATVQVGLTMTTRDEKVAQQKLTFTVVKKTGWWVCEVAG